jgi:hypothetical protein
MTDGTGEGLGFGERTLRSRRAILRDLARAAACGPLAACAARGDALVAQQRPQAPTKGLAPGSLTHADDALLDEIEHRAFRYFWEQSDPKTGLTKDRNLANSATDPRDIASIAAIGFGLTALAIADKRRWMKSAALAERVRATLRFLLNNAQQQHGFLLHFMHAGTGKRAFNSEISTIDTSLLLCGVLTCREHFHDKEIVSLATQLYERVDWPWFLNGGTALSMGWKPESGFLEQRRDHYCELSKIALHLKRITIGVGSGQNSRRACERYRCTARRKSGGIERERGIRVCGPRGELMRIVWNGVNDVGTEKPKIPDEWRV